MVEKAKTRTRLSPDQRYSQLLSIGINVFAKRGIARATHADIAQKADVSVATVFYYFPTREMLVTRVLQHTEETLDALINHLIEQDETPQKKLLKVANAFIDAALDEKDWLVLWFEWSTSIHKQLRLSHIDARKKIICKYLPLFTGSAANKTNLAEIFDSLCYLLHLHCYHESSKEKLQKKASVYIATLYADK